MTGGGTRQGSLGNCLSLDLSEYFNHFIRHIDFTESYMVEYCLRRPSHQIDGKNVTVSKAEPQFDEEEVKEEEESEVKEEEGEEADGDEASGDQEGVKDAEAVMEVSKEINDVD